MLQSNVQSMINIMNLTCYIPVHSLHCLILVNMKHYILRLQKYKNFRFSLAALVIFIISIQQEQRQNLSYNCKGKKVLKQKI